METISNINIGTYNERFDLTTPHKFDVKDIVSPNEFSNALKDFNVCTASSNNPTKLDGNIIYSNYRKCSTNRVIFHDVKKDTSIASVITKLIPLPKWRFVPEDIKDLRISRLYAGKALSGTNIHSHTRAFNYLVEGKKKWIMFPSNEHNRRALNSLNWNYGSIKENTLEWYNKNIDVLDNNITELQIYIQNEKEVFYIPGGYYHAVINIEDSYGITYSMKKPLRRMKKKTARSSSG